MIVTVALAFQPKKLSKLDEPCRTILDCDTGLICSKSICKTKVGYPCKTTSDCVLHFIGESTCLNGYCQSNVEIQKKEEISSAIRTQIYYNSLKTGYPIQINNVEVKLNHVPTKIIENNNEIWTVSKKKNNIYLTSLNTAKSIKIENQNVDDIYTAGNMLVYRIDDKFYKVSDNQEIEGFSKLTDIQTSSDKRTLYLIKNDTITIFKDDGTGKYVEQKTLNNAKLLNKDYGIYKVGNNIYLEDGTLLLNNGENVTFISVRGNDYILQNNRRETTSIGEIRY